MRLKINFSPTTCFDGDLDVKDDVEENSDEGISLRLICTLCSYDSGTENELKVIGF